MIGKCPFHSGRLAKYSAAVVASMKREYCEGNEANCARYQIVTTLGKEHVPTDLTPNDTKQAQEIILANNQKCGTPKTPAE